MDASKKRRVERSASAAAEIISCNHDLLVQILERVPAKTLIQFKSVSKSWLSLISSRPFSLLWLQQKHSPKIPRTFLTRFTRPQNKYIPLTLTQISNVDNSLGRFPDMYVHRTEIIQSCNGLLLCKLRTCYQVYNPTTNQSSYIPSPSPCCFVDPNHLYLAFDPLRSLHYKVVFLDEYTFGQESSFRVHIYSSETRAWRVVRGNPLRALSLYLSRGGVYCNGSIHWISFYQNDGSCIYFDVDQERAGSMPSLPSWPDTKFKRLMEVKGSLYVIGDRIRSTRPEFELAEMELDYSKWTLKYRVDLTRMVDFVSPEIIGSGVVRLLSLVPGKEDGDLGLVVLVGTKIIMTYTLKDNTLKKLHYVKRITDACPRDHLEYPDYRVFPHIETLFPV